MKVTLFLVIVGVILAAWGVGCYATDPSSTSAGPAAGLAVFGGGMAVTGWVMMIVKREDKSK